MCNLKRNLYKYYHIVQIILQLAFFVHSTMFLRLIDIKMYLCCSFIFTGILFVPLY